ncbi:MAG: MarR family transcriptional regulator [Bacteroidota bacterium]
MLQHELMDIEKKSMPTEFRSEWHKLRVNLLYSAAWLSKGTHDVLKPFGLTPKQFNVLGILNGHTDELPLTVLEIRNLMLDKMSDASRLIDRMHNKGIIRKFPCTKDKRATRVVLTDEGQKLLKTITKDESRFDQLVNTLSSKEAQLLNSLLDKMRD